MIDNFGRDIHYLRISVTDLCNYRCQYCMPEHGVDKCAHHDTMTHEEILEIAEAAVSLGIRKVRITGGEPLVHRDIVPLCRALGRLDGIEDISLTTNGALLAPLADELKAAGINRINISLDTLDAEKFRKITRCGNLADTLDGIQAALRCKMAPIKINTVLMGGFNDDEIEDLSALTLLYPMDVRFIELMPVGHAACLGRQAYIPCSTVLTKLPALRPVAADGGVARLYALPGAQGRIGLISALSHDFCGQCNRIRLTADGYLKPCLHSRDEIRVRGLHGDDLRQAIQSAIRLKPARHVALSASERSQSRRAMNRVGG